MPTTRSSLSSSITLRSARSATVSPGRSGSARAASAASRELSVLILRPALR